MTDTHHRQPGRHAVIFGRQLGIGLAARLTGGQPVRFLLLVVTGDGPGAAAGVAGGRVADAGEDAVLLAGLGYLGP